MPAATQQYPTKPMRLIEPFGVGGGPDLLARTLAQQLSKLWGQPVTVENVPGAGGTAGPAQVAKSPPDGYTLLLTTSAQAYSAVFSKSLPYDPLKDFIPIVPLSSQPYVLVAGNSAGITTVGELIAAAKAKPGQLKFGSRGVGTGTHLGLEKFNLAAGIKTVHFLPDGTMPSLTWSHTPSPEILPTCLRPSSSLCLIFAKADSGSRREQRSALVLATGGSNNRGSWCRRFQLPHLVWGMGAGWHSGRRG